MLLYDAHKGGLYMEDIEFKALDSEALVELLGSLEGLDDILNEMEGELKDEQKNDERRKDF